MKYFSVSQQWVLFVFALLLLGSLTFKFYYHPRPTLSETLAGETVVEVSGEVRQPGIYLFQSPPNLREAIERTGGLKESVQLDINFSSTIVETGTLLTVAKESISIYPSPPPLSPSPPGQRGRNTETLSLKEQDQGITHDEIRIRIGRMAANKLLVFSIPLNLNHVSVEDLCLIPGIGESLAKEMIAHRERRKGFRSIEELKNVRGIGEKKYQNLKGFFTTK
jgi:competence protein ComEA